MTKAASSITPQLRVAAYCRIASDSEARDATLDMQRGYFTERINANPAWAMAGIFSDIDCKLSKQLRNSRRWDLDVKKPEKIRELDKNL